MVCGDFNEVLHEHEKRGGMEVRAKRLVDFCQTLLDCNLQDLGAKGYKFTWRNKRLNGSFIEARLDRFVANTSWKDFFPKTVASNLVGSDSYHDPILLNLEPDLSRRRRDSVPFCFEAMWIRHEGCKEVIFEAWMTHQLG